jgi:hypothetical protein
MARVVGETGGAAIEGLKAERGSGVPRRLGTECCCREDTRGGGETEPPVRSDHLTHAPPMRKAKRLLNGSEGVDPSSEDRADVRYRLVPGLSSAGLPL